MDKKIEKVIQKGDNNTTIINSKFTILNNEMDRIEKLLKSGNPQEANEVFRDFRKRLIGQHVYWPFWYWDIEKLSNGELQIVSKPTSEKSLEKFPQKIVFNPILEKGENIENLIWDAYYNQKKIDVDIRWFKEIIGEHTMREERATDDNPIKMEIIPQEFPPPKPVKIYFRRGSFSLDYVELGLTKIINQDTAVLTNEKQEGRNFFVKVEINLSEHRSKFNITLEESYRNDVESVLIFYRMLLDSFKKKIQPVIQLHNSEGYFFKGEAGSWDFGIDNNISKKEIEKRVEVLEDLLEIEEYFDVKFNYPNSVGSEDLQKIWLLKRIMNGKKVIGKYKNFEFFLDVIYGRKALEYLLEKHNGENIIMRRSPYEVELFGEIISIKESNITLHNAVVKDLERIKRKLKYLEEGENIKITLVPQNENQNTYEEEFF